MRRLKTAVALCAVSALAVGIYLTFKYVDPVYIAPTLAVIPLAWSVLVLVHKYWVKERGGDPDEVPTSEQIGAAADWLAGAVADSWRKEAAARRIAAPAPVPVRWRWAGDLSPREAGRLAVPGAGPRPLPGSGRPGRIPAAGVVADLHEELYRRLPRGRLVIVGGPGSGKTGAMILLLLETLAWREKLASGVRAKVPVPVLLPLGGWDPASVSLSAWAAGVLNRDYRALRASSYGNDAASALISSGRVALFLDGLDEMPDNLRAMALRRLGTEAPELRIVMATRPAEYAEAVGKAPLVNAAVVELCPVQPAEAAKFLLHEQPADKRAAWQKVASHIKSNPGSGAAKALDNPLTLAMARDAYATDDPTAIIGSSSSPVDDTITAQFLARAYPDPRARGWLGCLARHLDGRDGDGPHDLEWWRMGGMLRPVTRILAVTLATAAVGTCVDLIIGGPFDLFAQLPGSLNHLTMPGRLMIVLLNGLLAGLLAGAVFGLAYAFVTIYGKANFEPSQVSLRLRGPRAMAAAFRRRNHAVRAASGFLVGLVGGIGYGAVEILVMELYLRIPGVETIRDALVITGFSIIMFGLTASISFFFVGVLEEPSDTGAAATPLTLLAESRSRILLLLAIFAPLTTIILAAGQWMAIGPLRGLLGPGPFSWSLLSVLSGGAIVGAIATISYILAFTAWGQWLVLTRVALPLTGRLPWKLTAFLDDAYRRGVLRQAGAVYQFRHLTLQQYLSQESQHWPAGDARIPLYLSRLVYGVMECEGRWSRYARCLRSQPSSI